MPDISSLVTASRISAFCPRVRSDILEAILTDAPQEFPRAGLDDSIKIAHFFAQIATETGGLARLDENLLYTTAARLQAVFGHGLFPTDDSAKPYLKNPEALASYVYAKKNGNTKKGDGWTYRGSGLIQLTGRGSFSAVDKLIGSQLEANPELARQPDSALKIALAYWSKNNISAVADSDTDASVEAVTKLINPALTGLKDRKSYFRKALKTFAPPTPVPATAIPPGPVPTARLAAAAGPALPMALAPAGELSGPQWVSRFPTSQSIDDLAPPFRENVKAFIGALRAAGAGVVISATYRPKERAYLMYWAWQIGMKGLDPSSVSPMAGVAILWVHPTLEKSRAAAKQMVAAFGMVHVAALNSRHTERMAIDMTVSWDGPLGLRQHDGSVKTIDTQPRNGSNSELIGVGAGYGVIKLSSDPPHWSNDGR